MKKYTYSAKQSDNKDKWYIVDASGAVLGRIATELASRLRGKHNPLYTPHVDTGDSVIVINAEKIVLTGKKWDKKIYYRHSGYMGGIKGITARELLEKQPEEMIRKAVRGMLPRNRLGRKLLAKLKVYSGTEHPHASQHPEVLESSFKK
ncbi:MAG: 50S ribosomal protein L13 [Desulfobacterales bacterium]|nr:50S ribosomal protein L13 [Desulfobacterales bacterium]